MKGLSSVIRHLGREARAIRDLLITHLSIKDSLLPLLTSEMRYQPALFTITTNYRRKKTASFDTVFLIVVGEEGFEPPTLWSQTRCATKLRYSPTNSFLGTLLEGSTLWSAIPNIRDALLNCAIHRQCLGLQGQGL